MTHLKQLAQSSESWRPKFKPPNPPSRKKTKKKTDGETKPRIPSHPEQNKIMQTTFIALREMGNPMVQERTSSVASRNPN
jgi:hypothetical protein